MFKIPKQEYTAEFKELAVKRVRSGGASRGAARIGPVSREVSRQRIRRGPGAQRTALPLLAANTGTYATSRAAA